MENPYRAAGTFSGPAYTERQADRDLFEGIEANQRYPYMLAPRQSGKSSLLLRIRTDLDRARFHCGFVDLSTFRRRQLRDYDAFLLRFFSDLAESLDVPPPKVSGRPKTDLLALLRAVPGPRVILLIDEVDALRRSRFKDTFFSDIRYIFNEREVDLELKRVQFVLAGAARVEELITDTARSPFNVGKSIELDDLSPLEIATLCEPLAGLGVTLPPELPARLHHHTGGSVYLSQLLLEQLWDWLARVSGPLPPPEAILAKIDALADYVIANAVRDIHFRNILKLLRDDAEAAAIWQRATAGHPLSDYEWDRLRAVGLAGRSHDSIYRNRIYERVFSGRVLPLTNLAGLQRLVVLLAAGLVFWFALWWTVLKPQAEERVRLAKDKARMELLTAQVAELARHLKDATQDVPTKDYEQLRQLPGQRENADELMAQYWERRALGAEQGGSRDETIVLWLKSRVYHDSPARQLAARVGLEAPASEIAATFRHQESVISAAFSPDGTRVVTASNDMTAQLWDAATAKPLGEPLRHDDHVVSAAFSPDGTRVITGSTDRSARIWESATGRALGEPLRHKDAVWRVAFSPDGARVITASGEGSAQIWNTATSKPLGGPLRHKNSVGYAAFSPDGTRVVTASYDETARLWDAATGKALGEPLQHKVPVHSAAFSPDGTRIVTASSDKIVRFWDAATGKALAETLRHEGGVWYAVFSYDGTRIVTASDDKTVQLWDAATGKALGEPFRHANSVTQAEFSPDGTRVISASWDGTARIWEVSIRKPLGKTLSHGNEVRSAVFSADGTRVVTVSDDKSAQVWDTATGKPLGKPLRHEGSVESAAFSPDGTRVITASDDHTALIWDAATGKVQGEPLRHAQAVSSAAFSADGTRIVTASGDHTALVWDVATRKALGEPLLNTIGVNRAAFSPDGTRVITASSDRSARIWDITTGKALGEPLRHKELVLSAAFSPDGTHVITTSSDKTAQLWDVATGKSLGEPLQHEDSVQSASFSADGQWIITQTSACIRWWQRMPTDRFRLAGIRWTRGIAWKPEPLPSRDGRTVKAVESITGDTVIVRTLTLGTDDPALPVLSGSPVELLAEWQRRLALKFEDETKSPKLIPAYGLSSNSAPPKRPLPDKSP